MQMTVRKKRSRQSNQMTGINEHLISQRAIKISITAKRTSIQQE
jgi:hypothetical protein